MYNFQNKFTDIPSEQLRIQAKCIHPSGSFIEFRQEDIEQSIVERFEQQVRKFPNRLAVKSKNYQFTYGELNEAANCVAYAILNRIGESEESVLLLIENDAPAIVSILGVLKAGKISMFLEPSHLHSRLTHILKDSQARIIVTNSSHFFLANALTKGSLQVLNIDELNSSLSTVNPGLSISPDIFSFIIYTSGSTGQPKGVIQNHRNMLHRIMNFTNTLHICPEDRQIFFTSPAYIAALWNILRALLNGAAVFPYDIKSEGIGQLAEWLNQEEITIFSGLVIFRQFPSILTGQEKFPNIRLVTLGGDTIFKRDIEHYKKYFSPECILVVALGTTEAARLTEYFIDKETEIVDSNVPVGYAVQDMDVQLLDDTGRAVGFNRIGEIAVKSRYLSPGYWQRPDLTRTVFLPVSDGGQERVYLTGDLGRMRPDGCLFHLGRKDYQVKVRGYRVEIVEVEKALLDLENIKEAVVVDGQDSIGEKRLIAYLVCDTQPAPSASSLRSALSQKLPDYGIPSTFVILDALPLTPNGKVDRRALPAPDWARSQPVETRVSPRDELELQLTKTWEKVLGVQPIGVTDNFFELGGQSLLALRLFVQIEKILDKNLPLATLFEAPTVEQLAIILRERGWSAPSTLLEEIESGGAGSQGLMRMKREIADHISAKSYAHLKQLYHKIKQHPSYRYLNRQHIKAKSSFTKRFLSYSPAQLEEKLRKIGLTEADTVYMHSAFNAFNGFLGGPQQIIDCILNVIGDDGNLVMVSMAYTGTTDDYLKAVKTFDAIKTESSMGIITEIFRRKKDVVRSLNPAHPILAFGPDAKWITSDHDKTMYSCGKGSPFEKILELNAKAFFFDVSFRAMTFFHYLEDRFKDTSPVRLYNDEPLENTVIDSKGNEITVKTYVFSKEARESRSARIIERELKKKNLMKTDRIGNTKLTLVNLKDVFGCAQKLVNTRIHFYN
jgi:amino acid adenylation domain-containing protein